MERLASVCLSFVLNPILMFQHIGRDLPSSIVVFLVALPLCLGIALASGAAPIAGLIAGIIGGIIVAPISGSHVGVSGPAAGLAVIVYDGIQEVGFEAFLLAVVIGGLAQLVLGIARAGIIGKCIPGKRHPRDARGHRHHHFHQANPARPWLRRCGRHHQSRQGVRRSVVLLLGDNLAYAAPTAMTVTAVCLVILLLWETSFMKAQSFTKVLSGSLVAVLAGVVVNLLTKSGAGALTAKQLVDVPTAHAANGIDPTAWGSLLTFLTFQPLATVPFDF